MIYSVVCVWNIGGYASTFAFILAGLRATFRPARPNADIGRININRYVLLHSEAAIEQRILRPLY